MVLTNNKIDDPMRGKGKKYNNPNSKIPPEVKQKFEEREIWLQNKLNSLKDNDTIQTQSGVQTLSKCRVLRGKDDDVIGVSIHWQ